MYFFFRESELSGRGSWHISQELAYQWLGALATPFWWSDAHINNALVRYVTAYTTLKVINFLNFTIYFNENFRWKQMNLSIIGQ